VTCWAADDFESGAAANWNTDGGSWGTTPIAASGTFAFTDSPIGLYSGCPGGASGCTVNSSATFGVPVMLPPGSTLDYDQICDTEQGFDFCVVEVSADRGGSWSEVARFDMGSDPAWANGVADPTAYRHASIDLGPFAYQMVLIRFRLQSDELLQYDGWFVDNVQINDASCTPVVSVRPPGTPASLRMLPPHPNPSHGTALFAFELPQAEQHVEFKVFDALGRERRTQPMGPLAAGSHEWQWNGRDDGGRSVGAGVYFVRLEVRSAKLMQKAFVLGR
jgi:hypothetical protein